MQCFTLIVNFIFCAVSFGHVPVEALRTVEVQFVFDEGENDTSVENRLQGPHDWRTAAAYNGRFAVLAALP